MTRLTTRDIISIPVELEAYDVLLKEMTGMDLRGIACRTYAVEEKALAHIAPRVRVGVVPVSWGLGAIQGFTETVARIAAYMGFDAFVTRAPNVAGLCEATERKAEIVMLSDDDCFAAINLRTGRTVGNSAATGRVFATGLDLMAGGIRGKTVLVVGCGRVGRWAGWTLLDLGARLTVVDLEPAKANDFVRDAGSKHPGKILVSDDLETALHTHDFLVDASTAGAFITAGHVSENTMIAAPGVPLGLDDSGLKAAAGRLLHDPLQLGVAAMVAGAARDQKAH